MSEFVVFGPQGGAVSAGVASITGTANQIIASTSTGNITLSTPQDIGTASTPTFAGVNGTTQFLQEIGGTTLGTWTATGLTLTAPYNGGGTSSLLTLSIPSIGSSNSIVFGESISVLDQSSHGGSTITGLNIVVDKTGNTGILPVTGLSLTATAGSRSGGGTLTNYYGLYSLLNGSQATTSNATGISNYGVYGEVANTLPIGEASLCYGVYGKVTTVSTSTGYALYATASGGSTSYGVYSAAGLNFFSGATTFGAAIILPAAASLTAATSFTFNTGNLLAGADATQNLGSASARWLQIFSQTLTSNAGTSTGTFNASGAISVQTSAAGIGNGADSTDDTLFTYSLPANAMSANGKSVRIISSGFIANNGNTKAVKYFVGSTAVVSDSAVLTNKSYKCTVEVTRIDATHVSVIAELFVGTNSETSLLTVTPNLVVSDLTANTLVLKLTGQSASSAANDVLGYQMRVEFLN